MMGLKERNFQSHTGLCLDDLVPAHNFYRQLQTKLNLSFVRDMVYDYYAPFGRPSIDPIVFFKLQLIMFFEAIRSERQLVDTVAMRLDHRWYLEYDLTETLPDHSILSRIRDRYGVAIFQRFFEHIVEQCVKAGLVLGWGVKRCSSTARLCWPMLITTSKFPAFIGSTFRIIWRPEG